MWAINPLLRSFIQHQSTQHQYKGPQWLNTSLLSNPELISSLQLIGLQIHLKYLFKKNVNTKEQSTNPQTLWEATKCFICDFCISFFSTLAETNAVTEIGHYFTVHPIFYLKMDSLIFALEKYYTISITQVIFDIILGM